MWLFWLLFAALRLLRCRYPFHTWQPDTYEQAPTAVTAVLSAIMVKMGCWDCYVGCFRCCLLVLRNGRQSFFLANDWYCEQPSGVPSG